MLQSEKIEAAVQSMLEKASAGFSRVIGGHYFLYERDDESTFVSLVAPWEWTRPELMSTFVAEVEAISDQRWVVLSGRRMAI